MDEKELESRAVICHCPECHGNSIVKYDQQYYVCFLCYRAYKYEDIHKHLLSQIQKLAESNASS